MTEKKEYRSAIRSRRFIRQAFMELMKEKKIEKITVTDIVNRADINRSTFYAHYTDVRGLVEEIQSEFVERAMAVVKEMDFRDLLHSPVPFLRWKNNLPTFPLPLRRFVQPRFRSLCYLHKMPHLSTCLMTAYTSY